MLWSELYRDGQEPSDGQIQEFVDTPLWGELANFLQQTYTARPKLFYSRCSMQEGFWKGWNIKYKKSGRALCTLYPKQRYFVALIPVGAKEAAEADLLIPLCDEYTQNVYNRTKSGTTGKSLAIEVTSEDILQDVKNLVALRVGTRQKQGER